MGSSFWILVSIAVLLLLFLIIWIFMSKGKKRPIDYYSWFWIGIIWLAVGIPLDNYVLSALGAVFFIAGLVNRKKWKENRVRWGDLDDNEKRIKVIVLIALGVLVLLGLVAFLLVEKGVF